MSQCMQRQAVRGTRRLKDEHLLKGLKGFLPLDASRRCVHPSLDISAFTHSDQVQNNSYSLQN